MAAGLRLLIKKPNEKKSFVLCSILMAFCLLKREINFIDFRSVTYVYSYLWAGPGILDGRGIPGKFCGGRRLRRC